MSHKQIVVPANIRAKAPTMPAEAMAYMFLSAFGVDLETLHGALAYMVTKKNHAMLFKCLAAAIQINGNVTFLGDIPDDANLACFVIVGTRPGIANQWNFSALHVAGHLAAHLSRTKLAEKTLKKAGSCIQWPAEKYPANEAGKINKEIAESWDPDTVRTVLNTQIPGIDAFFEGAKAYAKKFQVAIAPPSGQAAT
jgi:hypothetical protein